MQTDPVRIPRRFVSCALAALMAIAVLTGCKDQKVEEALDTDANGYVCMKCSSKFYTDRDVFASTCPQCKKPDIEQVLGYVCAADKHITVGARGRRGMACEKCRALTAGMTIPREADLKTWGAQKKTAAEVGS